MAQEVEEVREFLSILSGQVSNKEDHAALETSINGVIDELSRNHRPTQDPVSW